jgi:hypothetical protein
MRSDAAIERKRQRDRERIATIRAAMTPEERAERRRGHDATYREVHREERAAYDRGRRRGVAS